jgi:ribose 5-phosphate isomerase B
MIYLGSDHAGLEMKEKLNNFLKNKKLDFVDLGPFEYDSKDDYPDFATNVCKAVLKNKNNKGILICGAGHGMNIASNKFKGINASICWNKRSVECAKSHNGINVLCLPGRLISEKEGKNIVNVWLKTKVSSEKRHKRRLAKVIKIEGRGK